MFRLLAIAIDIVSSAVFLIPILIALQCIFFKQRSMQKKFLIIIFGIYLSAVFSATGMPAINSLKIDLSFNFVPLMDIFHSPVPYLKNTILNIILFIPFGFLLPVIWEEYRAPKDVLLMGFGLSISIELLQIFTLRLTDIDDLITNTAGTMIGYYAAGFFAKKLHTQLPEANAPHKYEPLFVMIITFVIMFLAQPFLSSAIWETALLYPII